MQSPTSTSTNSAGDFIKKFGLIYYVYIFFKENWKLVLSISIIICWLTVWAYIKHFNRLDLFIELIGNNKTDLIFIIFSFIPICFILLFILNLSGWISVIYLKLFDFDNNEKNANNKHSYKWIFILIPIVASILPLMLFLFLPEAWFSDIDNFINLVGCFCLIVLFPVKFYFEIKPYKYLKEVNKLFCFIFLFYFPFIIFRITGMKFMFYFVGGKLTTICIILILFIALIFTLISLTPLLFYFTELNKNKSSDQPHLNYYTIIKKIFCTSIGSLVLMFIILNKTFVFSSYAALRLLGVVDLNSVYEFSLVKNDVTVMKLANNNWKFNYEFNDHIIVTGNIGFHLGDIYLICKEKEKELFMESLRYDFAKQEIKPIDNKACISFKKDEINIIQIKQQNEN